MKEHIQLALCALVSVLVGFAAIALPQSALAADSHVQKVFLIEAGNIGGATFFYSGRSWSTFGGYMGKVSSFVPKDQMAFANGLLGDFPKADGAEKTDSLKTEDLAPDLLKMSSQKILWDIQFLSSEVHVAELKWGKTDANSTIDLVQKILKKIGSDKDTENSNSILGLTKLIELNHKDGKTQEMQSELLEARREALQLQTEALDSSLETQAFESLSQLVTTFETLEKMSAELYLNFKVENNADLGDFKSELPVHFALNTV